MSTADAAGTYLAERWRVLGRLERLNALFAHWEEVDANEHLPTDLRRADLEVPPLSRSEVQSLRREALAALAELDGDGS